MIKSCYVAFGPARVILDYGGVSTLCCSSCGGRRICLISICGERFYVRGGCRKTIRNSNRVITAWDRERGEWDRQRTLSWELNSQFRQ